MAFLKKKYFDNSILAPLKNKIYYYSSKFYDAQAFKLCTIRFIFFFVKLAHYPWLYRVAHVV